MVHYVLNMVRFRFPLQAQPSLPFGNNLADGQMFLRLAIFNYNKNVKLFECLGIDIWTIMRAANIREVRPLVLPTRVAPASCRRRSLDRALLVFLARVFGRTSRACDSPGIDAT